MTDQKLLLKHLLQSLDDSKATDIVVLDVQAQTTVTDYMVICSARSSRQTKAIAQKLIEDMKALQMPALSSVGLNGGEWVLLDFADFVVHVMQPDIRVFYNIEGLWQDTSNQHQ